MLVALAAALVLAVVVVVVRQASTSEAKRTLTIVAAVGLGLRLLAVTVIYVIAIRAHEEGTWLSDEASFYLSTEALLPTPLDNPLPQGLGHLAGNAYLGVLTWISVLLGQTSTVAFRIVNATLGTLVALLAALLAARFSGWRAGLLAGVLVAAWPTLVLWSATMLRDTLCSFVVVVVWWTLTSNRSVLQPRVVATLVLAMVLLVSLRPYLAGGVLMGMSAWAAFPFLARQSRTRLAIVAVLGVALAVGVAMQQTRRIDEAAHELVYRQMTTRMETIGLLYHDLEPDRPPGHPIFAPGVPVAIVDQNSDWILTGLVQESAAPDLLRVAFTDASVREIRDGELILLQSAPLSTAQILASLGAGVLRYLSGASASGDSSSLVWVVDALAWDLLLVLAVLGGLRARLPARDWLVPALVVLATVLALVSVPGAPGNDDRHRASQSTPLLVVFATGLVASRRPLASLVGRAVTTATSSATSAPAPAASRIRSAR